MSQINLTGEKCEARFELVGVTPGIRYAFFYKNKKSKKHFSVSQKLLVFKNMSSFNLHAVKNPYDPVVRNQLKFRSLFTEKLYHSSQIFLNMYSNEIQIQ